MSVIIGSARIGENGHITGGYVGDQKQYSTPDYSGEVSMQSFYVHSKGWFILRPKSAKIANKIAANMRDACNNKHLGYDQEGRYGVINKGIHTTVDTECDCSSLVRACVKEASGKDPGDFATSNEASVLENTGLFEARKRYSSGVTLYEGDVLVTCSKGHTVVVVSGASRGDSSTSTTTKSNGNKSVVEIAQEVIDGKWGSGDTRRQKLASAGYDYKEVQTKVNVLLGNSSSTASKNTAKTAVEKIADKYVKGKVYKTQVSDLNVRSSAGGTKLSKSQLTADAQKHCNSVGQLNKGTSVTCKAVKVKDGKVWIEIPSGWVCAYTGTKYYVK